MDGKTGEVLGAASSGVAVRPVAGLYAAGRAACGIASQYYVSGLSLADAVFSGRRAGGAIGGVAVV